MRWARALRSRADKIRCPQRLRSRCTRFRRTHPRTPRRRDRRRCVLRFLGSWGLIVLVGVGGCEGLTDVETRELTLGVSIEPSEIARSGPDSTVLVTTSVTNPTSSHAVFRFDGPPFRLSRDAEMRGRTVGFGYVIRQHGTGLTGPWSLSFGTRALVWEPFETKSRSWSVGIREFPIGRFDVVGIFAERDTPPVTLTVVP